MEFESFTKDVNRLLKDHKDCTKKLEFVKKKSQKEHLEPFYSSFNEYVFDLEIFKKF